MINLFKSSSLNSLQKKYDKLMKEAYDLSKTDPSSSQEKQAEAHQIHKRILAKAA